MKTEVYRINVATTEDRPGTYDVHTYHGDASYDRRGRLLSSWHEVHQAIGHHAVRILRIIGRCVRNGHTRGRINHPQITGFTIIWDLDDNLDW